MSHHTIRIDASYPGDTTYSNIETDVFNWKSNYSYLNHDLNQDLIVRNQNNTFWGFWAFDSTDTKSNLLDDIEAIVNGEVDWYKIQHHECSHDEGKSNCAWNTTRTGGTVPEGY